MTDLNTLEKLEKNPHYKLNAKQKAELEEKRRKPMVEFGVPPINRNEFDIHPTGQEKVARTSRKTTRTKN